MKRLHSLIKYTFLCAFAGIATGVSSQQTKLLTAEKHNEYGLVYSLPVTSFQIDIVATKETKIAGPFSKYSKIFTSDTKVIDKDEVNWTIETVRVTPFGVPDSQEYYVMQLKAGATTFIGVADDGMLLSINKEPEIQTIDPLSVEILEGEKVNGKEYLELVNEDFTSAISAYKKAQILTEEIMEIREAKLALTRGTAETMPTDGRQLEIMLASLENQEKALTNAFTGASWKERTIKSFSITPEDEGKLVICKLDPTQGIVDAAQKTGTPVTLSINLVSEAELPIDSKGEEKKVPKDAVMYSIPGTAQVTLSLGNESLFQQDFQMSQFGFRFGLNPAIFTDKKEPSFAIFDPTTGALKQLGTLKQ